ncbi:MAG TPA: hypothetical protein VJB87_03835 [Candidatus Nanoarchaeia archaeon]|nr:hypothetical protein [Candidatus Nanoarchaeia archaeon]
MANTALSSLRETLKSVLTGVFGGFILILYEKGLRNFSLIVGAIILMIVCWVGLILIEYCLSRKKK